MSKNESIEVSGKITLVSLVLFLGFSIAKYNVGKRWNKKVKNIVNGLFWLSLVIFIISLLVIIIIAIS